MERLQLICNAVREENWVAYIARARAESLPSFQTWNHQENRKPPPPPGKYRVPESLWAFHQKRGRAGENELGA